MAFLKENNKIVMELDGKLDAIVFTAGVLENNALLRAELINSLSNS